MKTMRHFLIVALTLLPGLASAITVDGTAEAFYGSAISTQQLGTVAGDNTSTAQGIANGSELDAAYGFVSNAVLYLVMAGNFDSDTGATPNDVLNIFFMTGPGGDHVLGNYYTATYGPPYRMNNMAGLTFDTGFTPNHWIGANIGPDDANTPPITMYADYQMVCSNCPVPTSARSLRPTLPRTMSWSSPGRATAI